jgi:hypothetical protein
MRPSRRQLYGESLREIGVLMMVFVPLDGIFGTKVLGPINMCVYAVFGLMLVFLGAEIERNGHDTD